MAALVVPAEVILLAIVWRLRKAGRLNIRLASALIGLAIFVFIVLAGTGSDTRNGQSAVVGGIVAVVVTGAAMAVLAIARRNGNNTLPW